MHYFIAALTKYAEFHGRARRAEFWYFNLFVVIIGFAISFLEALLNVEGQILSGLFNLGILLPSIAVGVRRMHDVNKSGWFLLIPIYSFVLAVTDGTKGDNRFGSDPKATASK
ncbi:MAG: DUF805 domain-containing protein [Patescibacteria group bacterium]